MTPVERRCHIKARIARILVGLALGFAAVGTALGGPIHDAARKGDQTRVIALLKQNPELVSSRDTLGNTPLHIAAMHDQPAIAELLLANGADVNAQNTVARADWDGVWRSGETPLTFALLSYEHKKMMELLLSHGAEVNIMLSGGDTPLHRAVQRDLPYDVELLLANGADPNAKGLNWQTPVHRAVLLNRTRILVILLDHGADPNAKDSRARTPMYYAERSYTSYYGQTSSNEKAIALLRAHGGHE